MSEPRKRPPEKRRRIPVVSRAGRYALRIVSTALVLALLIALLPYASGLIHLLFPTAGDLAKRGVTVISRKLEQSARLETSTAEVEGVISSQAALKILGWNWNVRDNAIRYRYRASVGVDLRKAAAEAAGGRIVVSLPEPEVLTDSIEMLELERNDRYLEMKEEEQQKLLNEERERLRAETLARYGSSGELWQNTVKALEDTFAGWLGLTGGEVRFEFVPRAEQPEEST